MPLQLLIEDGFKRGLKRGQQWGVIWDFGSLHQRHRGEERPTDEEVLYTRGINAWGALFSHQHMTSLLVTELPPKYPSGYDLDDGANTAAYHDRGWTTAEAAWSYMLKRSADLVLDISRLSGREIDRAGLVRSCACYDERTPPVLPDEMDAALETKTFSDWDDLPLVCRLYREVLHRMLGRVRSVHYTNMMWSDVEACQLCKIIALGKMEKLEALHLYGNRIGDVGLNELARVITSGAMPALVRISTDRPNHFDLRMVCESKGIELYKPEVVATQRAGTPSRPSGTKSHRPSSGSLSHRASSGDNTYRAGSGTYRAGNGTYRAGSSSYRASSSTNREGLSSEGSGSNSEVGGGADADAGERTPHRPGLKIWETTIGPASQQAEPTVGPTVDSSTARVLSTATAVMTSNAEAAARTSGSGSGGGASTYRGGQSARVRHSAFAERMLAEAREARGEAKAGEQKPLRPGQASHRAAVPPGSVRPAARPQTAREAAYGPMSYRPTALPATGQKTAGPAPVTATSAARTLSTEHATAASGAQDDDASTYRAGQSARVRHSAFAERMLAEAKAKRESELAALRPPTMRGGIQSTRISSGANHALGASSVRHGGASTRIRAQPGMIQQWSSS